MKANKTNIATLESMVDWEVIEQDENINIIQSTWDFKCKHYLDCLIKKSKSRFSARGDQLLEGIYIF